MSRTARLLSGGMIWLPVCSDIGGEASWRQKALCRDSSHVGKFPRDAEIGEGSWRLSRTWRRQGHGVIARFAHVPLAHAAAPAALGQVHVNVILVITVGTGAQDGGETGTRVFPQPFAEVLGHVRIGQLHHCASGEFERADVERVRSAVLGKSRADDAIAAAAIISREVIDAPERSAKGAHRGRYVLAYPMHDGLGKTAAQYRRRRHRHLRFVDEPYRLEPYDIVHVAFARPDQRRQRRRNRQFGREPQPASGGRRLLGHALWRRLRRWNLP